MPPQSLVVPVELELRDGTAKQGFAVWSSFERNYLPFYERRQDAKWQGPEEFIRALSQAPASNAAKAWVAENNRRLAADSGYFISYSITTEYPFLSFYDKLHTIVPQPGVAFEEGAKQSLPFNQVRKINLGAGSEAFWLDGGYPEFNSQTLALLATSPTAMVEDSTGHSFMRCDKDLFAVYSSDSDRLRAVGHVLLSQTTKTMWSLTGTPRTYSLDGAPFQVTLLDVNRLSTFLSTSATVVTWTATRRRTSVWTPRNAAQPVEFDKLLMQLPAPEKIRCQASDPYGRSLGSWEVEGQAGANEIRFPGGVPESFWGTSEYPIQCRTEYLEAGLEVVARSYLKN